MNGKEETIEGVYSASFVGHGGYADPKSRIYEGKIEGMEYDDEATLQEQGVTLVSWIYPLPVDNNFVFSHIVILSSRVIFPMVFIGVLALLAMIIFVKKEKEFKNSKINKISVIFNFIIGILVIPFMIAYGSLIDIGGSSAALNQQMSYIVPAFSILCLAASVGFRRKIMLKRDCLLHLQGLYFWQE